MSSNSRQIVSEFFNDYVGRFLVLGVYKLNIGIPEEPCSSLLEKGWYGLYCEPNPFSLVNIIKESKDYNADVICAAVNTTPDIVPFYLSESHSYLSSMDSRWMDIILQHDPDNNTMPRDDYKMYINTVTPTQLFDAFGYDFDCISIDIELPRHRTHQILKQIDFNKVTAKMVVVETNYEPSDEYMRSFGFSVKHSGVDTFYTR